MASNHNRIVHFIGSVNLESTDAVFEAIGRHLGDRAPRIPDGETGERADWIVWQKHIFENNPSFDKVTAVENEIRPDQPLHIYGLKSGVAPTDVSFPPLGYADTAIKSFENFKKAKSDGHIPADAKFMIAIPSAPAIPGVMIAGAYEQITAWLPVFETLLIAEVEAIAQALPVDEISIQWDAAFEMYASDSAGLNLFEPLSASLATLGNATPDEVDLCYHFCFGDYNGKGMPTETVAPAVRFANTLAEQLNRPADLIHIPVPGDATRDFFEPLKTLKTDDQTRICLGLVHEGNGLEGNVEVMRAAHSVWPDFDVAAACGLGRRQQEKIPEILDLLKACAQTNL